MPLEGVGQVWMTPHARHIGDKQVPSVWVAVFVGGKLFGQESIDSRLDVYSFPDGLGTPFVSVGLGRAEECSVRWAYDASAMLVLSNQVFVTLNTRPLEVWCSAVVLHDSAICASVYILDAPVPNCQGDMVRCACRWWMTQMITTMEKRSCNLSNWKTRA